MGSSSSRDEAATVTVAEMMGAAQAGLERGWSDIDLLVVRPDGIATDEDPWASQLVQLRSAVGRWTGNDCELIEYSMQEIEDAFAAREAFISGIGRRAVVLHGARSYLHRPQRLRRTVAAGG